MQLPQADIVDDANIEAASPPIVYWRDMNPWIFAEMTRRCAMCRQNTGSTLDAINRLSSSSSFIKRILKYIEDNHKCWIAKPFSVEDLKSTHFTVTATRRSHWITQLITQETELDFIIIIFAMFYFIVVFMCDCQFLIPM